MTAPDGSEDPPGAADGVDAAPPAASGDSPTHEVTLAWRSGREETLVLPADETVLDAAEARGVALPFGCKTGACATCTGKVEQGRVEHVRPPRALKERHLQAGYVLLCVAEPRTDCRIEVGADVQADLVENPWR